MVLQQCAQEALVRQAHDKLNEINQRLAQANKTMNTHDSDLAYITEQLGQMNRNRVSAMQSLSKVDDLFEKQKTKFQEVERLFFDIKNDFVNDYENWGPDDIGRWVSFIDNGRFSKYEEAVAGGLASNLIPSINITNFTDESLMKIGILNKTDRELLLSHISRLKTRKRTTHQFDKEFKTISPTTVNTFLVVDTNPPRPTRGRHRAYPLTHHSIYSNHSFGRSSRGGKSMVMEQRRRMFEPSSRAGCRGIWQSDTSL